MSIILTSIELMTRMKPGIIPFYPNTLKRISWASLFAAGGCCDHGNTSVICFYLFICLFFIYYRAMAHDITTSQLKICSDGYEMLIDTSLVEPMAFNRGSMYQFIGEICINEKLTLRARIACCIDGMDMELFNQALDIRRKYLKEEIYPQVHLE